MEAGQFVNELLAKANESILIGKDVTEVAKEVLQEFEALGVRLPMEKWPSVHICPEGFEEATRSGFWAHAAAAVDAQTTAVQRAQHVNG